MALASEQPAYNLPEPADESHLPDAVSRPNLTNSTRWYDDTAPASSPILKNEGLLASRLKQNGRTPAHTMTLKALGPSSDRGFDNSRVSYDGDEEDASTFIEDEDDPTDLPDPASDLYSINDRPSFDNDSGGEELNSTPLSVKDLSARADIIMANARRRLNLVNGGLKGARSSLLLSPTSNSSFESQLRKASSGSPSFEQDENSMERELTSPKSVDAQFTSSRHKRITSDTSLPSASGSVVKGSRSLEQMRNKDYNSRQPLAKTSTDFGNLQPVLENEYSIESPEPSANVYPKRPVGQTVVGSGGMAFPVPPREQSLVFRDLQARANNVQGKLANLRKRNREDAERRRSLQMSRPSMSSISSTASDYSDGYAKDFDENRGVVGEERLTPPHSIRKSIDAEPIESSSGPNGNGDLAFPEEDEDLYDPSQADRVIYADYDDHDNEDDNDFYSILEEVEQEDDDDELPPVEGAHEDRADAFDYESFILSSLTGSLDRQRSSSIGSSDSASTAKAPEYPSDEENEVDGVGEEEAKPWQGYDQTNASVSSFNSFATAMEGEEESDVESDDIDQAWPMPPSNKGTEPEVEDTTRGATPVPKTPAKRPASMALSALLGANTTSPAVTLNQDDQALVYTMAEKIREICLRLSDESSAESDAENWRKRLDSARRILEGQDGGTTA